MKIVLQLSFVALCVTGYKFPPDFKFGVATSSYQIEGAWNTNGKGENIWDYQTHTFPDKIVDRTNGDIACDSYNQIDEDIKNLKAMKVHFYRFSLSWARILPNGFSNKINEDGIRYYNELIDKLIENGIEPMVTIYHWDLPQKLQELGGWANPKIVDYFEQYAAICYENFGDRVKTWITINEPDPICNLGYGVAEMAPYIHSDGIGSYLCGHHVLMSHAAAYHLYKTRFYETQKGRVGITIDSNWYEPASPNQPEEIEAAERKIQIFFGWFAHPIFSKEGNYPKIMREIVDKKSEAQGFPISRLPYFSEYEINRIKGSFDFFGLNHYTTSLCTVRQEEHDIPSHENDAGAYCFKDPSWESTAKEVFKVVPWGLRKLLNWIKNEYDNPEVIITENGYAGFPNETVDDLRRINFHNTYLTAVLEAIHEDGCNVSAYTAWSFMDNFEWSNGYTERFGLHYVDFDDKMRSRTPKKSVYVYQNIIVTGEIDEDLIPDRYLH